MKKKARFYLGFFICSGERVKTVFTCSRVFLSLICTNARTRINTGFFVHSLISISQAVRGRTGQVTVLVPGGDRSGPTEAAAETAALGRRGLLRAANWKARPQVGWRQVKVLPAFSKAAGFGGRYVPVGRCSAADRAGRRDRRPKVSGLQGAEAPVFLSVSKNGGTDVPLLGCLRARGFCLRKGRAGWHRARSRGYLLRSVRPVRCTSSTGCAGLRSRPRDAVPHPASLLKKA